MALGPDFTMYTRTLPSNTLKQAMLRSVENGTLLASAATEALQTLLMVRKSVKMCRRVTFGKLPLLFVIYVKILKRTP